MIWHGFWWQWTAGGAEALLAFMLTRYYTNPVRKMNAVGISFGDSKHPSKVTGKQFQRLKREHRDYGGPKPHKHCADCYQAFDLVDSQIYKVTLCPDCLTQRQDWRRTRDHCADCGTTKDARPRPTFGVVLCQRCCFERKAELFLNGKAG